VPDRDTHRSELAGRFDDLASQFSNLRVEVGKLSVSLENLGKAFEEWRGQNRKEHDWLGEDKEKLSDAITTIMARLAELEPKVTTMLENTAKQGGDILDLRPRVHDLETAAERSESTIARRQANWPQYLVAAIAVVMCLFTIWTSRNPPPPPPARIDPDSLAQAMAEYQREHPTAAFVGGGDQHGRR